MLAQSVNGKTGCPVTSCGFLSNTCPGKQLKWMQSSGTSGFLGFPLLVTSLGQERVGSCHLISRPVLPFLFFSPLSHSLSCPGDRAAPAWALGCYSGLQFQRPASGVACVSVHRLSFQLPRMTCLLHQCHFHRLTK